MSTHTIPTSDGDQKNAISDKRLLSSSSISFISISIVARLGSVAARVGLLMRSGLIGDEGCDWTGERTLGQSFDIVHRREANFLGGGRPKNPGAEEDAVSPLGTFRPKSPLNLLTRLLLLVTIPVDRLLSFFWRLSTYASNSPNSSAASWSTLAASSTVP